MGLNIAGLVIDHNYDKDIEKLSHDLKWGIEIVEEIPFEQVSKNWTPDGEFRLYFSEDATMIFFPFEWVVDEYSSSEGYSLNYAYSETSMTFKLDYFEDGKSLRSIIESEGERQQAFGTPLEEEAIEESADGLIMNLMEKTFENSFWNVDPNAVGFRCRKVNYTPPVVEVEEEIEIEQTKERKKWWQLWK